jgi:hypothetical protein
MPVHGPLENSAPALVALAALMPPPDECVIVVDTPSQPGGGALLPPGSQRVEVAFRSGPACARNAGSAAVKADVLLFIDADVVVPADTVVRVKAEFAEHPEISALFGSYDAAPADPGFLSQYRNLLHHFVHQQARTEASTFWAGLGAVRTDVFREAGGFDPRFARPTIEDIELGGRLCRAGHHIRLVKELQGRHLKRWTAVGMLQTDLLDRGIPWTRLLLTHGHMPTDLNVDNTARWSTAVAGAGVMLTLIALWRPWCVAGAAVCLAFVVFLNRRFYGFLARHRGWGFAGRSLPWHFLFYVECGLAAVIGLLLHLALGSRRAGTPSLP